MTKITLSLEPRKVLGKRVKTLRKQGIIPGNIFGNKVESTAVQVRKTIFRPVFEQAGETQIVYVNIDGEKAERPVLVSNTQFDPISGDLIHVDFRQVNLKEKITAYIPVELVGESPAVKELAASIIASIDEIEVEALPADLPEKITVDLSTLKNIGDSVKVADLGVDRSKIEVLTDPETVLVLVAEQQKEEEVTAPTETQVIGEETAPAAGEKAEEKKEAASTPAK